jgi:hypothetical protein
MRTATRKKWILAWRLFPLAVLLACGAPSSDSTACDSLPRDTCRKTVGCFLDYGGQVDSYFCRAANNACEQLTNSGGESACESAPGCTWVPGGCYCPDGLECFCGGGPPPMCQAS